MKRMLISGTAVLMAATAFAVPAQAQDSFDVSAPCSPAVQCVRDLADDVFDIVESVGPIVGGLCRRVFTVCMM